VLARPYVECGLVLDGQHFAGHGSEAQQSGRGQGGVRAVQRERTTFSANDNVSGKTHWLRLAVEAEFLEDLSFRARIVIDVACKQNI